jgi:autotransporter-associated beta strand protein
MSILLALLTGSLATMATLSAQTLVTNTNTAGGWVTNNSSTNFWDGTSAFNSTNFSSAARGALYGAVFTNTSGSITIANTVFLNALLYNGTSGSFSFGTNATNGILNFQGANAGYRIAAGSATVTNNNQIVASTNMGITNNANLIIADTGGSNAITVAANQNMIFTGSGTTVFLGQRGFSLTNGASLLITNTTLIYTNVSGGGFTFGSGSGTTTLGSSTFTSFNTANGIDIGSKETLVVSTGGVMTNHTVKSAANSSDSTLVLTNGGRFFNRAGADTGLARGTGTNNRILIGSSLGSQTSTFHAGSRGILIGGSSQTAGSSNNVVLISSNGLLTNYVNMNVGGVGSGVNGGSVLLGSNNTLNRFIVTNGGVVWGSGVLSVGYSAADNSNSIIITDNGSLLNNGGGNINIAYTTNTFTGVITNSGTPYTILSSQFGLASGNTLQVLSGGVLSNAGTVTIGGQASGSNSMNIFGGTAYVSGVNLGNVITVTNVTTTNTNVPIYVTNTYNNVGYLNLSNSGTTNGTIVARASGALISGNGTVTLAGNGGIDAATFVATNSAMITGAGTLTVNGLGGTGTLTLSGSNNYTGGTLINGGTLAFTAGNSLGTNQVSNNATLAFTGSSAQTLSNNITGSGAFASSGTGTLTLAGNNSYTGGTTLSAGRLILDNTNSLGSSGIISQTGGTLQFTASNATDYSSRFSTAAGQKYNYDLNGQNVIYSNGLTSSASTLDLVDTIGTGTLTLAGGNSGINTVSLSSGTLNVGASTAFVNSGYAATSTVAFVNFTGGSLNFGTAGTTNVYAGTIGANVGSTAAIYITNGAMVYSINPNTAGRIQIGATNKPNSTNMMVLGSGGVYSNTSQVTILGLFNSTNQLNMISNNGGTYYGQIMQMLRNAGSGGTNAFIQTAGTSDFSSNFQVMTGNANQTNDNIVNQLLISGGSFTVRGGAYAGGTRISSLFLGNNSAGSMMSNVYNLISNGAANFTLSDGISFGAATMTSAGVTNVLVMGNGTLGSGTMTLKSLFVGNTNQIGYTNQIIWNGGVLRAGGSTGTNFWTNLPNTLATISNAGGVFDINGFSNTIAQNLEGTGGLTVTNSSNSVGTLTLSGSNTFNGLTLSSDTANITAGSSNAFGAGAVTLNAGTLNLGNLTLTNAITVTGGTLTNGTLSNNGGTFAFNNSTAVNVGANLAGSSALSKSGTGTATLSAATSYSGGTVINGGTLAVSATGALGSGSVTNNATLAYTGAGSSTIANVISGTGALNVNSGTLSLTGGLLSGGAVTVNGTLNFAGATSTPGLFAGSGTLNQAAGTLTLASGSHSFGGAANVTGGTLNVDSGASFTPSTLTASGGTLSGKGTLGKTVLGGTSTLNVSGGGTAGTLTMGSLTINGGTFAWNLFGTTGDLVNVTGGVDFAALQTITINNAVGTNWDYTLGTNYTILTAGSYTNFSVSKFSVSNAGNAWANGKWEVSNSVANGLVLVYTANNTAIMVSSDAGVITTQTVATNTVFADSGTPTPVIMTGAGEYILDMTNTYSGNTTIGSGTLTAQNNSSFGTSAIFLGTATNGGSNAALNINTAGVVVSNTISVAGSGSNTITGNTAGAVTYAGTVSLGTNVTLASVAGGNLIFTGVISGSGTATASGSGTVTLAGANTYSGGTVLNGGTLALSNNAAMGTGALQVSGNSTVQALTSVTVTNNAAISNGVTATVDAAGNNLTASATFPDPDPSRPVPPRAPER